MVPFSGDKKEGETHILYDPSISKRGVSVCAARAPRKKSVDDYEAASYSQLHMHCLYLEIHNLAVNGKERRSDGSYEVT
ncbi:hypothetical protein HPP92_028290 [Vanilla planifolia]|uniref:Uncharacterized protein n=1 Tax=Vanilla planifolia TaxID=51239 RepID=A0A835U3M0_VANPL|nr:hypothetical protein HPP92_028290 [Vanilla planifolia]KAG0447593.1 hypothetical protein HPP92_028272 [Vanilla planifolia]